MSRTRELKRIAKDPFHQQVLEALGRHLDPQVFEACMADLLRDVFPGMVPVPGGDDAGMDAAIADGKGEPYPLVCTTGEDVAGNLRKSLDAFLARGLSSRKVALATSRALTPPETRKLFGLASEKGFTLLQVFERSVLASLLYRDTAWCKRLLGLTGTPSALSIVPLSRRPQVDIELKGRDEDAEWLRSTSGDRVVLGFPGSGKTHLFSSLIRGGWPALFLVSDDDTAIANAIRNQNPGIVIVDDAHVAPDRLVRLRRFRAEIQGEFEIVASSWPGASADVIEAIGSPPESRIHNLGPLTRAQILEIFQDLDVRPRDEILRELVSQAGNKPGLAVTIAQLWRQGEWQKILDGSVLSRTLLVLFKGLTGVEVVDVLAAFSLGGRRGMSLEAVARFLEIPSRDVLKIVAYLAAGGVLSEVDAERLAVNPQVLRSALLRQIFFTGSPIRLDYRKLLPSAPSLAESVGEIVAARAYGAVIPPDELHDLVLRANSHQAWSILAVLSEEEAQWVLDNYPDEILKLAADLLHRIPRMAIPRIFERAAEMSRSKEVKSDGPMNLLSSWVQEIEAPQGDWIRRRRLVACAAKTFLLNDGDRGTAIHGICIGLNPTVRGSSQDPGLGTTITMRSGLLPSGQLQELESIWGEAQDAVQEIDTASWRHLSGLLWDWLSPEYSSRGAPVSEDTRHFMQCFASRLIRDFALRVGNSPGLRAGVKRLASQFGLRLELEVDPVFELLYPESRQEEAIQNSAINALAMEWARKSPQDVAKKISFYEQEALRTSQDWPQNMPALCQSLAESVSAPEDWLDPLLKEGLRSHLVSPFLQRAVVLRRDGWENWLAFYLDREPLIWAATSIILQLPDPPPDLLGHALMKAVEDIRLVEILCLQRRVPFPVLKLLLDLPSWEASLAAAVGEWCADPQGEVREEVRPEWRAAILRAKTGEYEETRQTVGFQYWLGVILASDADLALDWLRSRLRDPDLPCSFMGDSPFSRAASALRREQKKELLEELKPASILQSLIPALIERNEELFRRLLEIRSLTDFHLESLGGPQAPGWESFVCAALDAGYDPESIGRASTEPSYGSSHDYAGSGLEYWERWDQAFAAFEGHPRRDLREVARFGRAEVKEEIARAREFQRRFELNGVR